MKGKIKLLISLKKKIVKDKVQHEVPLCKQLQRTDIYLSAAFEKGYPKTEFFLYDPTGNSFLPKLKNGY